MEQSKPSYYGILPASVRYDKTIPAGAKVLYSELTALCSKEGFCWASNGYFAELYDVAKMTISTWIKSLSDSGHIKVDYNNGDKNNTYRKIYMGITKNLYIPIEKPIAPPIEKPITNNTSNNNTSNIKKGDKSPFFKSFIDLIKIINPSYYHDAKQAKQLKNIENRCKKDFSEAKKVIDKFLLLKNSGADFWANQPVTPSAIYSVWDRVLSSNIKNNKIIKPESVEDLYGN